MKILVVGGKGMLGQALTQELERRSLTHISLSKAELDITDYKQTCLRLQEVKPTHVVNCAAYTNVDLAEDEEEHALAVNAQGVVHLAQAAQAQGARLIHISTDYVFNGIQCNPYHELTPCSPLNAYGRSKYLGETAAKQHHPHPCIIRTSWLYGSGGSNFVEMMLRLMKEKEVIRVVNDQWGRPTYCNDLAKAILALLEEEGLFHFSNGGTTSWYGFAQEIFHQARELGFSLQNVVIEAVESHEVPRPAKRPQFPVLSLDKICRSLGTPCPWQEALRSYLAHTSRNLAT